MEKYTVVVHGKIFDESVNEWLPCSKDVTVTCSYGEARIQALEKSSLNSVTGVKDLFAGTIFGSDKKILNQRRPF